MSPTSLLDPVDRCCTCSIKSTCQTTRCTCKKQGKHCHSCTCIDRCQNKPQPPPADNHPSGREKDHSTGNLTPSGNSPPQTNTSEPPPQLFTNTDPKPPPKVSVEYSIDDILSNGNTGRDADDLLTFAYGRSIVEGPRSDDNLGADDLFWVEAWKKLTPLPSSLYKVPDSSVGKRLIQVLTTELPSFEECF